MPSAFRVDLVSLVALLGALALLAGCERRKSEPLSARTGATTPRVGDDLPITYERLRGARLAAIQSGTTWDFMDTRFTLVNRGGPLPGNVAASILGPGIAVNRVVGDWRFDGKAGVIILSNIERDDQKVDATVSVPIHGAGAVRADFGAEQYNIFPLEMVRRMDR